MEKYFCNCLNVIVNVTTDGVREVRGRDLIQVDFNDELESCDPFFSAILLDVKLSISGVEVAQSMLAKERPYGDWIVYNCLNCGCDTHALHAIKGVDRVLLPTTMEHDKTLLQNIIQSSSYSTTFKMKVFKPDERKQNTAVNLQQKNIYEVTEKLDKFLQKLIKTEEEAMNERIRIFKEKQHYQFLELTRKANQDKEYVLRNIRQYEISNDSLFDSINESYFGTPFPESRDQSTDLPQIIRARPIPLKSVDQTDNSTIAHSLPTRIMSPKGKGFSRNSHRIRNSSQSSMRSRTYSENDDALFDLEGFHDSKSCEPFYESEEDSSGDATSLESSGGFGIPHTTRGMGHGSRVYATSVPVEIPLFMNMKNSYEPESDDENQEPSPSPNHIADSIKALARSMQDSTGMFGELPKPRLNMPYSLR